MTTLAIIPNWKNKTAKFKGTVAAGEHVSVTIQNDNGEGDPFIDDTTTLRLRVVDFDGRTLAIFPEPEEILPSFEASEEVDEGSEAESTSVADAWDEDVSPLRCTLNLNTVQMLKAVPPAANVPLLFVLDDYESKTLYFKEQFPVEYWPRLKGEEEPTGLDNYKDIIADFNAQLDGYDSRISEAENIANAATENASAASERAGSAVATANSAIAIAQDAKNGARDSAAAAVAASERAVSAAEAAEAAAESINSPDATLTEEGVAADAKATGDAIATERTRAEAAEDTKADKENTYTKAEVDAAVAMATPSDYDSVKDRLATAEGKIPTQASARNQLADKEFVNSSIATNTATFRGTYNLVTDLSLTTSATHEQVAEKIATLSITQENNDYCFVQVPRTDAEPTIIDRIDRYKCSVAEGSIASWGYEWSLNNSSFTADQWAAINSGITSTAVAKLEALPTAAALTTALAGRVPTSRTINGKALSGNITLSASDVGAATAAQGALADTALQPVDATLTPIYSDTPTFSEWVCSPEGTSISWNSDDNRWVFSYFGDGFDSTATDRLAVEVVSAPGIMPILTATRTRTDIIGYTLGDQSDKPLQPKGDYYGKAETDAKLDGKVSKSGDTMSGPLVAQMFEVPNGAYGGLCLRYADFEATIYYHGATGVAIGVTQGLGGTYYINFQNKGGTVAFKSDIPDVSGLAAKAADPTAGHLAALDANGNPVDSGIAAGDILTIVALTNSAETMASILARLDAINAAHKHVFFDCSSIDVNPRLYLCTIMVDADANAVRVYDQVTGKLYTGPYNSTETIGEVFAKAVDAYYPIVVTADTLDGVTVTGQTVTLHEGADASAPVYDTATYNGSPVTFVVPKGFQYFVEITPNLAGHFSPSTATGVANAPVSVTLTYQDTSNITDYIGLKGFLDTVAADTSLTTDAERIAFAQAALIPAAGGAKEIPDTFTNTAGTVYDNPMVVYAIDYVKGADEQMHLAALVQRKWCSSYDTQFDAPEGVECDSSTETVAEDGVYYYGLALGATSKTAADLTLLELSPGDALPYADYETIYKSSLRDTTRNSLQYGDNNWGRSAYRQHLNSSAAPGAWWSSTHVGDNAPSNLSSVRGYMAGCSAALLAAAKPVYIKTWPNYITDGANSLDTVYETLDTFFLPSGVEVYASVNMDGVYPVEGPLSEYWKIRMGLENPSTAAASTRIMYRELPVGSTATRSAASVRLRSAARGNSNTVWSVNASGQVSGNGASSASAGVPACAIY